MAKCASQIKPRSAAPANWKQSEHRECHDSLAKAAVQPMAAPRAMLKKFLAGKTNLTMICYCQKIHRHWQTIINVTQTYHLNEKYWVLPTGDLVRKRLKGIQKLVKMLFPAGKHSQRRTSASEYPFAHNVTYDIHWSPGFTERNRWEIFKPLEHLF